MVLKRKETHNSRDSITGRKSVVNVICAVKSSKSVVMPNITIKYFVPKNATMRSKLPKGEP
jgi:hypothetical protein